MLTFPRILLRSLLVAAGAILSDGLVSFLLASFGVSFIETMGDLMLVEIAGLFLVAGIVEFSYSIGGAGLRKTVLGSKDEFSRSAHIEAGRKALVLILAGIFLFVVLIAVAGLIRS